MKKKTGALYVLLSAIVAMIGAFAIACGGDEEPVPDTPPAVVGGAEAGAYYFEPSDGVEYLLTLDANGRTVTLSAPPAIHSGTYELDDKTLTLNLGDYGQINATYENDEISFVYENKSLVLLRKVERTVRFESNGQSINVINVMNGKTLAQPADPPAIPGKIFVDWCLDKEGKTPFIFNSQIVKSNITLYAFWIDSSASNKPFTVRFDLNYADAPAVSSVQTRLNKVPALTTPTREGYTFNGWWYSPTEKGDELSRKISEGDVISENMTLFAEWFPNTTEDKLASPAPTVTANNITWSSVSGAVSYVVSITGPEGFTPITQSVVVNSFNFDQTDLPAGDYVITVVAQSSNPSVADSDPIKRVIRKNGLNRVSFYDIVNESVFRFDGVTNATEYKLYVECGDSAHNHSPISLGAATSYNFSNCIIKRGGIKFKVVAEAEGYAPSTSEQFVFVKDLGTLTGLAYDDATQTVSWTAVENADGYAIAISCDDSSHEHLTYVEGGVTSINIKECTPGVDGVTVSVYPYARGFASPEASSIECNKTALASPRDIRIINDILSWRAVAGASSYEVKIGDVTQTVSAASFDLSTLDIWAVGNDYQISVKAIGTGTESLYSDVVDARYYALYRSMEYKRNHISWRHVIGADYYEIRVNGGAATRVDDGANKLKITLTKTGANNIEMRYIDNGTPSEWASLSVQAYAVMFDVNGGEGVAAPQYLANGDEITFPESIINYGYYIDGWYNAPGGPSVNAGRYVDNVFVGNSNVQLYANWNPGKFTVTLDYNGKGTGSVTTVEVVYGEPFVLPTPDTISDPTLGFGGWSVMRDEEMLLTDEFGNSKEEWNYARSITIYAVWRSVLSYTKTPDGMSYQVSKGTITKSVESITIPAEYQADGDDRPYKVTRIQGNAFSGCNDLKYVRLPSTVESIDNTSFRNCSSLLQIEVYTVDDVQGIYWSENGVLYGENEATHTNGVIAFPRGRTDETFTLSDAVASIGDRAFYNANILELIIPTSVTFVAAEAFYGAHMSSLKFAYAEDGEEVQNLNLHKDSFKGYSYLVSLQLPARLAEIDIEMFSGCSKLAEINVEEGGNSYSSVDGMLCSGDIEKTLVYCPRAREGVIELDDCIVEIGEKAFYKCNKITEITISGFVSKIGKQAFNGCNTKDGLKKVTFAGPAFVDLVIDEEAFGNAEKSTDACTMLTTVIFEQGSRVAQINANAFRYCYNLTAIEIPATMTKIGNYAFANCSRLTDITFVQSSQPLSLGEGAFEACNWLESITLPANITEFNDGVFNGCAKLATVNVADDNPVLASVDGVLFNKDITAIYFYPLGREGNYDLPSTVTSIGTGVFRNKINITSISIGKNVTYIGNYAFDGCTNLESITFDQDITDAEELEIGEEAFANCTSLGSIVLPSRVTLISKGMLKGDRAITEFTIPTTVTEVGESAFENCSGLGTISIPKNVVTLGYRAFAGCTGITSVTFEDDRTEMLHMTDVDGEWYEYQKDGADAIAGSTFTFTGCSSLITVTLSEKVENIGGQAFYQCNRLTTINIPTTVKYIGSGAFAQCASLRDVTFAPGGETELVFGNPAYWTISTGQGGGTQPVWAGVFSECIALEEITLPDRLINIPAYTFHKCAGLKEVFISKNIRNGEDNAQNKFPVLGIGEYAFAECTSLETVEFAMDGTAPLTIGYFAFYKCTSLTSINLPARLADTIDVNGGTVYALAYATTLPSSPTTTIKPSSSAHFPMYSPFTGCSALEEINIAPGGKYESINGVVTTSYTYETTQDVDGVPTNVSVTTESKKAKMILAPDGIKGDANGKLVIPDYVWAIGANAFSSCKNITELVFENTVTENRDQSLPAPADILELGTKAINSNGSENTMSSWGAFASCSALTKVTLPSRLTRIGLGAFRDCGRLTSVTFSPNTTDFIIADDAFYNCRKLASISFPSSLKSIGKKAFYYAVEMTTINFADGTKLTSIGDNAFEKCVFTSIKLPEVETLGSSIFSASKLNSISLPNTIKSIGNAFANCNTITSVSIYTIAGGESSIVAENGIIYSTDGKQLIYVPLGYMPEVDEDGLRTYTIKDGVQKISPSAFINNKYIEKVIIPNTVEEIGNKAFMSCESLIEVCFEQDDDGAANTLKLGTGTYTVENTTSGEAGQVFWGSRNLVKVNLPSRLTSMGTFTFKGCRSLLDVTFAPGCRLTTIPQATFAYTDLGKTDEAGRAEEGIKLPSSVTTIATKAFQGSKIKKIVLPANIAWSSTNKTPISSYLFADCSELEYAEFKGVLATTGTNLFQNCTSLKTVIFQEGLHTIDSYAFANTGDLSNFTIPSTVAIYGTYAFSESRLTSITIPAQGGRNILKADATDGAAKTGKFNNYMFYKCPELTSVTFESDDNLTAQVSFGTYTFAECPKLVTVTLPEKMKTTGLGNYAFQNSGISNITIPADITTISNYAFNNCKNLKSIVIPDGSATANKAINTFAFAGSGLTSIALPQRLYTIGISAFDGCLDLETVTFHSNTTVTALGSSVSATSGVGTGGRAFANCPKLKSITLPASLTSIGNRAFEGTALTSITIPNKVHTIGHYAFANTPLASVTFAKNTSDSYAIKTVHSYAFTNTQLTSFTVPKTVDKIASNPFVNCTKLTAITVEDGNASYKSVDGILYNADSTVLVAVPMNTTGAFDVPASVTNIAEGAFIGSKITSVNIPNGDAIIGNNAFEDCTNLIEVGLAAGVHIGNFAFKGCTALEEIALPGDLYIGLGVFSGCTSLETVTLTDPNFHYNNLAAIASSGIDSITIGEGITQIASSAFKGDDFIKSVTISEGVTKIGANAFEDCVNLEYVYLPSTIAAKTSNGLGASAFKNTGLKTVEFAEGSVIETIGANAFENTPYLTHIDLPSTMTAIANYAFMGSGLTSIVIPGNVTQVTKGAFKDCVDLASVQFTPNAEGLYVLTQFSDECFMNTALTSINIPDTVKQHYAQFVNGTAIETIEFGADTTMVYTNVFLNNTTIKHIILNDKTTSIGKNAFEGATSVESIVIPESVTTINAYVFKGWTAAQTIYFEALTPGASFDVDWKTDCNANIVWGYGQED